MFDGISGAQQALKELGVSVTLYDSFEINPHAKWVTQTNFPFTRQLGDICLDHHSVRLPYYDLVIFGSPCTDLSVARKNRQSLAGKSSSLFYRAAEILRQVKPKYFLMENVASMSEESRNEISSILKVQPVEINSRWFTGQNRPRLYWFNWFDLGLPSQAVDFKTKLLSPIDLITGKLHLSGEAEQYMARLVSDGRSHWDFGHHSDTANQHSSCVVANFKKGVPYNVLIDRRMNPKMYRHFHPVECERLQGFPDDYTKILPKTYRFECLGNAFTVPVIKHLLKSII